MQRTYVKLIDDLNGKPAEETVQFGLDGARYEIDLTRDNAKGMRQALSPFTEAASKVPTRVGRTGQPRDTARHERGTRTAEREQRRTVRTWWRRFQTDLEVPYAAYGKIPTKVRAEYERLQGGPVPARTVSSPMAAPVQVARP